MFFFNLKYFKQKKIFTILRISYHNFIFIKFYYFLKVFYCLYFIIERKLYIQKHVYKKNEVRDSFKLFVVVIFRHYKAQISKEIETQHWLQCSNVSTACSTCLYCSTCGFETSYAGLKPSDIHSPMYLGGLFSMNAAMPSCLSRVGMSWETIKHAVSFQ